jgi:hypothetical protein
VVLRLDLVLTLEEYQSEYGEGGETRDTLPLDHGVERVETVEAPVAEAEHVCEGLDRGACVCANAPSTPDMRWLSSRRRYLSSSSRGSRARKEQK